jgi:hypothetical protein
MLTARFGKKLHAYSQAMHVCAFMCIEMSRKNFNADPFLRLPRVIFVDALGALW